MRGRPFDDRWPRGLRRRGGVRPLANLIFQVNDGLTLPPDLVFEIADASPQPRLRHEADHRQHERKRRDEEHPENE